MLFSTLATALLVSVVVGAETPANVPVTVGQTSGAGACSAMNRCAAATPCCSDYGYCGTGTFCLGGCAPFGSQAPQQCAPQPVCLSSTYTFQNASRLVNATIYNNDPTNVDFTVDQGTPLITNQGQLVLTMTKAQGGTKISSTRAVLYGNIVAKIRSGKWAGVVTAFITMSGVADEIDWEFPGNRTNVGQTNYYFEGDTADYTHGGLSDLSDSFENFHDYGINWTPDTLEWTVDGVVTRTLNKADTLNTATGIYNYPSTPSRIQLSIWPGGIPSAPAGTIAWAGGLIDWTNSDYLTTGYYYALVQSVTVTCYTTTLNAATDGYNYGNNGTTAIPTINISNNGTQIYAKSATGENMQAGKTSSTSSNANAGVFVSSASSLVLGVSTSLVGLLLVVAAML